MSAQSEKEFFNDFNEKFVKVRKLIEEEYKYDPADEPYQSKYKARDILSEMKKALSKHKCEQMKHDAMLGAILFYTGLIDFDTEEISSAEKTLMEALTLLTPHGLKPEIIITLININSTLGLLWSGRDEPDKAKHFLLQAKELYENFKCSLQMPVVIEQVILNNIENPMENFNTLEKSYTLTLFYLAQVYGLLKDKLKSAIYCHVTLKRQLDYMDYDHIDWALNAATLSQFFAEQCWFEQARHHLAAASTILATYEDILEGERSDTEAFQAKLERFQHRSADVARCWAKYCILLMSSSKERLLNDQVDDVCNDISNLKIEDEDIENEIKDIKFPTLDVTKHETVSSKYLLTFPEAREVFLQCQNWLNKAKEYYKLETLASDYILITQDLSQAYSNLTFFEDNEERQCKMLKKRITILEDVLKEVSPTYYMVYCRQMWYEIAEISTDLLNIKLEKASNNTTPHALTKINKLCEQSIVYSNKVLDSLKDKNGEYPEKIDAEWVNPLINSFLFIARNSMKKIAVNKVQQLENYTTSLNCYKYVVKICAKDENCANIVKEELSLCQQMVEILPIKMQRLEGEIKEGLTTIRPMIN